MKIIIKKNFDLGFAILLCIFLLQDPLSCWIPIFSYFDEIESICCLSVLFYFGFFKRRKRGIDRNQKQYLKCFFIMLVLGVFGNLFSMYQSLPYIFVDILTFSKFTINLFAVNYIIKSHKISRYEDTAWKVISVISICLFVLVIHEEFFSPLFPYLSDRYGLKSLQLFFSNQTYLSQIGAILSIIHYYLGENRKGTTFFCIIDMLISASTLRTKALGFVIVTMLVVFVFGKKKMITKLNVICFGVILVFAGFIVGFEYLNIYYFSGNEMSVRLMSLFGGIELANIFMPFGSGFGTYGSLGAKLNYSSAYDMLGLRYIYMSDFMYDNFWATLLGELGYLGTFVYIVLIIRLILMVVQIRKYTTRPFWCGILLCAYLVIASLGETSFNSFYACFMGLFVGHLYSRKNIQKDVYLNEKNFLPNKYVSI